MKPAAEAEQDEADEALREHEYHRLLAATAAAQERLAQARPGGREPPAPGTTASTPSGSASRAAERASSPRPRSAPAVRIAPHAASTPSSAAAARSASNAPMHDPDQEVHVTCRSHDSRTVPRREADRPSESPRVMAATR